MGVVAPEEIVNELKALATWLEHLPAASGLQLEGGRMLVPHPHLCAQLLRLWLPVEGHA